MVILSIIVFLAGAVYFFLRQPQFGSIATGDIWEKIQNSTNYKNGQFQNVNNTPQLTGEVGMFTVMKEFFFNKDKRNKPSSTLPSHKTNLFQLDTDENVLVWFGHSSYFVQLDRRKFLVDPVFSGHASPISFTTRSFKGSDVYTVSDMPPVDYLLITHDHYDHLDHKTMVQLKPKIKQVIAGLGVGAHLERWGFKPDMITEKDWNEEVLLESGFVINTAPARHFSGRAFKRNNSLWLSFVLTTPNRKIFIGGDSGYDEHFNMIGEQFGPFDLAILENGQYNQYWKHIHMMPEEAVQAAIDLKAKALMPVHWGKFSLSLHAWHEPITRAVDEARLKGMKLLHPMIGEKVNLDRQENFNEWWKFDCT